MKPEAKVRKMRTPSSDGTRTKSSKQHSVRRHAERYCALNQAITDAATAEEQIAARNALINDPIAGRMYRSPMS